MAHSGVPGATGNTGGGKTSTGCKIRTASANAVTYMEKYAALMGGAISKGGLTNTAKALTLAAPEAGSP